MTKNCLWFSSQVCHCKFSQRLLNLTIENSSAGQTLNFGVPDDRSDLLESLSPGFLYLDV